MPVKMSIDSKQKAEKMCQKKLKKKSKLYQTVLLKNTLKYVQNTEYVTFACDDDLEIVEYEPFHKVRCKDISIDDIDNVLSEMLFPCPRPPSEDFAFDWPESVSERTEPKAFEASDDNLNTSVVPDNEVLEYSSDDDYIMELLRNRTNCTVIKLDNNNNR